MRLPKGRGAPESGKNVLGVVLSPVIGIFLTVFLDLLSFGMFIPDIQLRAKALGAQGTAIGATIAVYSLVQLLTAPILGRLSDVAGRRRVLLITTLVSTVAYAVYGQASELWLMIVARGLLGMAGASVGVAFAYMADMTEPKDRAKGMGLIGAAFGLGFILGPVFGVVLLRIAHDSPVLLGSAGAALSLVNLLYVWLLLPESKPKHPGEAVPQFENFRVAFGTPQLAFLLLMFFAINLGFTNLESTYFQLLADPRAVFRLDVDEAKKVGAIVLALVGVLGAFTQGYLVRRLMPVFGEVKLVRAAYFVMTPTFLLVPVAALWFPGILLILLMGVASGLAQPCLSSLISRNAPPRMQGGIFGITQSLGATARLLGPLISNTTFAWRPQLPYIIGAAIIAFPAMGAWRLRQPPLEETAIGDAALTIA